MENNIPENTKAFGFINKDAEELYKTILVIVDAEFQNELVNVMEKNVTNEARAHSAGRISGLNDILRLLQSEREFMLKFRTDGNQSKPHQSPRVD
jgi:phosphoribosylaminoimidazole (AIR) synthetase